MPPTKRMFLCVGALLLIAAGLGWTQTVAQPATALYVGHSARLTAQIPRQWKADPTGTFEYVGAGGFVASQSLSGSTLADACADLATSPRFDAPAAVAETTWAGGPACRVDGAIEGAAASALGVAHPHPFELRGQRYAFAAVIASSDDLEAIAATLDFAPERVTPGAYIASVLDLMETRAYWADDVDWDLARREAGAMVDGLPSIEMAQGALLAMVAKLRAAGDNHSYVLLPHQTDAFVEADGFGMLVGGRQVLLVFPGGPAARAGVRVGDLIEAVDGRPFLPTQRPIDPVALGGPDPANRWGESARLTLRRSGVPAAIAVTVGYGPYERYVPPSGHRLPGAIGYLELFHFSTPDKRADYAESANRIIAAVDRPATCGWVVDLRLNQGGNYSPMISGVGPILGDGTFVGWQRAGGSRSWVTYEGGRISQDGVEISNYFGGRMYELHRPHPPVAVLIGPLTGSSGEVATLAFVGRSDARLFGERTAGATTAILGFPLFDGSLLGLAESAMIDRTGATHLAGIEPDQHVAIDWTAYGTANDPVLAAAQAWLNDQPACAHAVSSSS